MAKHLKQISKSLIRREVLASLDSLRERGQVTSILELCEDAEANLLEISIGLAKRQLRIQSKRLSSADLPDDVVVIESKPFQVSVHTAPVTSDGAPDSVHIQILPILRGKSQIEKPIFEASSKIEGLGRYHCVTVSAPDSLATEAERIVQAISFALETGYAWLAEKVSLILSEIRDGAVDALYSHIRTVLPQHAHMICLFLFREEKGIYIHDALATRAWMDRAGKRSIHSTHSPIELVGRFTSAIINLQDSFSRIVHIERKTRNFPLVRAAYSHSGLQIAEMAIYEDDSFVAHPLVTEDKFLLSAGYPVASRAQIETTLSAEKPKFRDILLNARKELAQMHQRLEAMRLIGRGGIRAAEWAGTLLGSGVAAYEKLKG